MNDNKARILMVDDDGRNLRVLEAILGPVGYQLEEALDGPEALALVADDPPDLILLDVMMPGMSGFDVCKKLKADPDTESIPIILVTALSEKEAKIEGSEAGADDFISKPVDPTELRVRVKSLLRIRSLYLNLEDSYVKLKKLEEMRETLTHMLIHDLRSPLASIGAFLELLEIKEYIAEEPEAQEFLGVTKDSVKRLMNMVTNMLDLARLEVGEMKLDLKPVDLHALASEVLVDLDGLALQRDVLMGNQMPLDLPRVCGDEDIVRRVLTNLISNAIQHSNKDCKVMMQGELCDTGVRVTVCDEGVGIPKAHQEDIFEKFGQVVTHGNGRRKYSTGLGLTFCKLAIEASGGRIGVESEEGEGSRFWFELPSVVV